MGKIYIIPHTHFDAEVFLTREEYLSWGFSNLLDALRLLDAEKDFRFTLEQVCYIEPFFERFPECRADFIRFIREGRLEIVCGMYSMADLNIPSGESIARQFLRGVNYCREVLGVEVSIGWTLDSFGHPPQIPQILHRCGFKHLAFARATELDVSEFIWVAPDESEILCHWMPFGYGGIGMQESQARFDEAVLRRVDALSKYAIGDALLITEGGDLETPSPLLPSRVKNFNANHKDMKLIIATPSEYFSEIEKLRPILRHIKADFNPLFQGCYSSRIQVKQGNRRLENRLTTAEVLDAVVALNVSKESFGAMWDPVLFNQFHDDICGCHVDKVFMLIMERYNISEEAALAVTRSGLERLAELANTSGDGVPVLVFNPLGWTRRDIVSAKVGFVQAGVQDISVMDSSGASLFCTLSDVKRYADGDIREAQVCFIADLPSFGYEVFHILPKTEYSFRSMFTDIKYGFQELNTVFMENSRVSLEVDYFTGVIKSLAFRDSGVELIDPVRPWGSMIVKEPDVGDFWELNSSLRGCMTHPLQRSRPISCLSGAEYSKDAGGTCSYNRDIIRQIFEIRRNFGKSAFKYSITLYEGIDRIDVEGEIVNREEDVRYRAVVPVGIKDGMILRGIPFGFTLQPEGEYPAVDFMDYSDGANGLSLLNVGLPGNAVLEGVMTLALLKATSYKGYNGSGFTEELSAKGGFEIGKSIPFKYSLLPHVGPCDPALTARCARELNAPPEIVKCEKHSGKLPARYSFMEIGCPDVITTCLKATNGGYILRMYEAGGKAHPHVTAQIGLKVSGVVDVDMTEKELPNRTDLKLESNTLSFDLDAHEIRTFLLKGGAQHESN